MFGQFQFGQPAFAGEDASAVVPVPPVFQSFTESFDYWDNGVPVIIPDAPGDFSEWDNGVPVVDLRSKRQQFNPSGTATASAVLVGAYNLSGSGSGQAEGTGSLAATLNVSAAGTGQALASATLVFLSTVNISGAGSGSSTASASLSVVGPPSVFGIRIISPRQPTLHSLDFTSHPFAYRRVAASAPRARHPGD